MTATEKAQDLRKQATAARERADRLETQADEMEAIATDPLKAMEFELSELRQRVKDLESRPAVVKETIIRDLAPYIQPLPWIAPVPKRGSPWRDDRVIWGAGGKSTFEVNGTMRPESILMLNGK